ncbi:MAG: hypothetical protein M0008_04905 [Actinomycetota bacterium]|nr:hypothetical protein [Actinomycetota bacterium]
MLEGNAGVVAVAERRKAPNLHLGERERKVADTCVGCLLAKKSYLHYPKALVGGLPIATGVIEGQVNSW